MQGDVKDKKVKEGKDLGSITLDESDTNFKHVLSLGRTENQAGCIAGEAATNSAEPSTGRPKGPPWDSPIGR